MDDFSKKLIGFYTEIENALSLQTVQMEAYATAHAAFHDRILKVTSQKATASDLADINSWLSTQDQLGLANDFKAYSMAAQRVLDHSTAAQEQCTAIKEYIKQNPRSDAASQANIGAVDMMIELFKSTQGTREAIQSDLNEMDGLYGTLLRMLPALQPVHTPQPPRTPKNPGM